MGTDNAILTAQAEYAALAQLPENRQSAYRDLFDQVTSFDELALLREALQTGTPLGIEIFKTAIETVLDVKVGYARRGRPKKMPEG